MKMSIRERGVIRFKPTSQRYWHKRVCCDFNRHKDDDDEKKQFILLLVIK